MIDEIYSAILYFVNRFFLYVLCSSYWIIIDSFGYICHNSANCENNNLGILLVW